MTDVGGPRGSGTGGALVHRLRRLGSGRTVLFLGAHPDDEETGLVAYLCAQARARVVYWSATRGEGGQNRVGAERGEALGIVRTWESQAARAVDGGEVLYGPFYDFGYVKTADAALDRWGREELVAEIVRAIRLVQPQVVISRWAGGPHDGHGHHRALGWAARQAFAAATDPGSWSGLDPVAYPPWAPQKLYHSMAGDWQPGEELQHGVRVPEHEREGLLRVNTGAFDPVAGSSYEELASLSRNHHRSQGLSFLPERGDCFYYYRLVHSSVPVPTPETSVFDGIDGRLAAVAERPGSPGPLAPLFDQAEKSADAAAEAFRPQDPRQSGQHLLDVAGALDDARRLVESAAGDEPARQALLRWLRHRTVEAHSLAARCLGITAELTLARSRVAPGGTVPATARLSSGDAAVVGGARLEVRTPVGWQVRDVAEPTPVAVDAGEELRAGMEIGVGEAADLSCPYWLREPRSASRYRWPAEAPLGQPFDDPLVSAVWHVDVEGRRLVLEQPGLMREASAGGFRELPLQVVPPVALSPRETHVVVPASRQATRLDLGVTVESIEARARPGVLAPAMPEGWDVHPRAAEADIAGDGQRHTVAFEVTVPATPDDGVSEVGFGVALGDRRYGVVLNPVRRSSAATLGSRADDDYVAEVFMVAPATVSVHVVDVAFVRTLRYAYVPGAEEGILDALSRFDLSIDVLGAQDLAYADLSVYDTIVVGPNAYVVRDDVRRTGGRLLEYVESGGTLVVQYQAYPYELGSLAPYPFRYNRPHDRVTLPGAAVTVLGRDNPVLLGPNRIGSRDFDGWVHDRGMYFFGEWDRRYVPLLSCSDPGEDQLGGGLLTAAYGQGTYVYAAFSFFRQIPAGVPGAIRLFANLLALAETKVLERIERIRSTELFGVMCREDVYEIARRMSERYWADGSYLCRQGDVDSDLYIVADGTVEVIREDAGSERVVYVAGPGEAVGELAVLAEIPRSATLRTRGGATTLRLRGDDFRSLIIEKPDISVRLIRLLARKLAGGEVPS